MGSSSLSVPTWTTGVRLSTSLPFPQTPLPTEPPYSLPFNKQPLQPFNFKPTGMNLRWGCICAYTREKPRQPGKESARKRRALISPVPLLGLSYLPESTQWFQWAPVLPLKPRRTSWDWFSLRWSQRQAQVVTVRSPVWCLLSLNVHSFLSTLAVLENNTKSTVFALCLS